MLSPGTQLWLPTRTSQPSLTFLQALEGSDVVGTEVQPSVYLRGDPQKPERIIFEQQVLLPTRGAEELECRRFAFSKLLLVKDNIELLMSQ